LTQEYWDGLIGSTIDNTYVLGRLIGHTDESAVYLSSYGGESAAVKLRVAQYGTAAVPQLEHPHISRLFASGRCDLSGAVFDYYVTEVADENLAPAIADRALSTDETREMLDPVLQALSYLHDRGLAHGAIKPSNVLAFGDSVKLSADSVRPAGAVASPEDDMRALGLLIIEALTRERQPSSIANVPQPFRDIVEHSLQLDPALRWSARQAAMRLSGALPEAPASVVERTGAKTRLVPVWAYPAAAAVLLGLWFGLARSGSTSASSTSASSTSASSSAPAPPPVVLPVQRPPQPPKPTPFEGTVVRPAAKPAPQPAGQGWFVVVASYTREPDAAKEARDLSRSFPQFRPSVFPPSAIDTHYLVIIGSGLSADGAESLRQRAVVAGLPPDTYIKKYPASR
jgi:hypothetical protein